MLREVPDGKEWVTRDDTFGRGEFAHDEFRYCGFSLPILSLD